MKENHNNINQTDLLLYNLKKEIKQEKWYWHVLNLAWTAGPVTLIGVYVGYYAGYGKATSFNTVIYFGIYTILAGILAIIFQAFKNASLNPQIEKHKYQLNYIIEKYLDYINYCKEYLVLSLPKNQRDLMSAWWVLTSCSSDIDMIQKAVYMVTKDKELAKSVQTIEYYRKQGFNQLLIEEYEKIEPRLNKFIETIDPNFPSLAKILTERFQGKTKNTKLGIERPQGFLSRLICLADEDSECDDKYTRIEDIIALFNLTIELVLNRNILIIQPEFKNDKHFEHLIHEYEEKISDFKLIRRQRNNLVKEMVEKINENFKGKEFTTFGASSILLNDILVELKSSHKYRKLLKDKEIRRYWEKINNKNKRLKILINRLKSIYSKKLAKTDLYETDVDIKEDFINIDEKDKIDVVNSLSDIITKYEKREVNIQSIKRICFETINVLDEKMNISEHDKQISLEESMATDINIVEPLFTTAYKIELIVNQINELQHSRTKAVHRFARHLTQYYNFKISDKLEQKLINDYQAVKERLEEITEPSENLGSISLENLETEIFTA